MGVAMASEVPGLVKPALGVQYSVWAVMHNKVATGAGRTGYCATKPYESPTKQVHKHCACLAVVAVQARQMRLRSARASELPIQAFTCTILHGKDVTWWQ